MNKPIHPADIYAGTRLKERRKYLGYSQSYIASKLEVSFQQIQKYERGINRMSASTLHQLSLILDVTAAYFFAPKAQGISDTNKLSSAHFINSLPNQSGSTQDLYSSRVNSARVVLKRSYRS